MYYMQFLPQKEDLKKKQAHGFDSMPLSRQLIVASAYLIYRENKE
jgi:hypothetical protein